MGYQDLNNLSGLPLFDAVRDNGFGDVDLIASEVKDVLSKACGVCGSGLINTLGSGGYHCQNCGTSEGFGLGDEELGPRQNNLCEKFGSLVPDELSDIQIGSLGFFIVSESRFGGGGYTEVKVTEIERVSQKVQKYYILIGSTKYRFQVNLNKNTISEFHIQRSTKLGRGSGKRWEKKQPPELFQAFLEEKFKAKLAD